MKHSSLPVLTLLVCCIYGCPVWADDDSQAAKAIVLAVPPDHVERAKRGTELFRSEVRTILAEHCLDCHGGKSIKADFDLSSRETLMASGYVGESADESYLLELITHEAEPHMPLSADRLPEASIAKIRTWLDLGSPYDKPLVEKEADNTTPGGLVVTDHDRGFWSFQPLRDVPIPVVENTQWCRTPIDHFILAAQEAAGLQPNGLASPRTLIRRATFDLLGLPAEPAAVETFAHGDDPAAWGELVDQLLESHHYGERWARHWMDVARFAESHGYEQDYDRPHAYHYRDFLIQAFNGDMPFDQFLHWQLAGDELAPDDRLAMSATGFLGAGAFPTQLTEAEFESARYDELDDMVATTGVALLGLSVGCARCHDHKFDPISARDYYRMAATFTTTIRSEIELDNDPVANQRKQAAWDATLAERERQLREFETTTLPTLFSAWLESLDADAKPEAPAMTIEPDVLVAISQVQAKAKPDSKPYQKAIGWFATTVPQWNEINDAVKKHRDQKPELDVTTMMVASEGLPPMKHHADSRGFPHFYPETYHLMRGDVGQKQEAAVPGFLQVLMPADADPSAWQVASPRDEMRSSFRRATLANWMTDTQSGAGALVARVIVNRLWQYHFGRGLVATPNDFGVSGERPSHPELLEWLAHDLVTHGWQLKRLHRLIMTSSVYQQAADWDERRAAIDRENGLLWRWTPRRLEAEAIRDSMLAVSGKLDPTMYGPGTLDQNMTRRSVYFFIKRSQLIPVMMLFDWPEHLVSIGNRSNTTVAPQALMFLNSLPGRAYASAFAERLPVESRERAIEAGYRLALARLPRPEEAALANNFLRQQEKLYRGQGVSAAAAAARIDFCQALLSMNEFIYIE
jgi:hypothetical protein